MNSIASKVAYINGLMEGLGFNNKTKEEKVLGEIVLVLKEITEKLEDFEDFQKETEDYLDIIDSDLYDVEKEMFGDEYDEEDLDSEDNYDDYIHLKCSKCNDTINVDKNILDSNSEINCPNCHETISLHDEEK